MRSLSLGVAFSYAAVLSSAFVIPIDKEVAQSPLFKELFGPHDDSQHNGPSSWRDHIPSKESIASFFDDTKDDIDSVVQGAISSADEKKAKLQHDMIQILDSKVKTKHADSTIWDIVSNNKHTTKFTKLVGEYPDLVDLLKSTSANHTLFVPINKAFKHVPKELEKPSKEVLENIIRYHIGVGDHPSHSLLHSYTVPTKLNEELLGDEAQRLRVNIGWGGLHLNFYSKIVKGNIQAKNGYIHAVNKILFPPLFAGREISLFPSKFSTLLLAYEKTDFVKFIHGVDMTGSTIFVPSNFAFTRLGPKANAFLFNTELGKKYLTALLKYQIVHDATLYSDAIYDKTGRDDGDSSTRDHYELPSVLDDAPVRVDIARAHGFAFMYVNHHVRVSFQSVPAKNGVIHVVDKVPIPPCKHGKCTSELDEDEHISVDDLVERLDAYIEPDHVSHIDADYSYVEPDDHEYL